MPNRAIIYIQPGSVPADRQSEVCLSYCNARGLLGVAIVQPYGAADAVWLVTAGRAGHIVAAYAARYRPGDIRDLAAAAGVRVEYARPPHVRREVGELIARVYRNSGRDVSVTARLLGEPTGNIAATLQRLGILPGNGTAPDSRE
jgi:hypothetical protein